MTLKRSSDVIIIGAGPAGLSAAVVAAASGLNVHILDEFMEPGGRMLGQFHEEKGHWWVGRRVAEELIDQCEALGVQIRCGVSVHGMLRKENIWEIRTSQGPVTAPRVLLATGGSEISIPIPGWTLPGVMSIGAAQVMTNVHYVKPGRRGVIIGVNVLAMAIARELTVSGVSIAGIVLPSPGLLAGKNAIPKENLKKLMGLSHLAPSPVLRRGGKIANSLGMTNVVAQVFPRRGIKMWDIPLKLRTAAVSINGNEHVESVTIVDMNANGHFIPGSEREEEVDFVALAGGLYPLAELASVAGCPFVYLDELGGHVPLHSESMRTPLDGLYVAGNITGVESALVAMAQGRLAATSICNDAGVLGERGNNQSVEALEDVRQVRASALIQFHPGIQDARDKLYSMCNL